MDKIVTQIGGFLITSRRDGGGDGENTTVANIVSHDTRMMTNSRRPTRGRGLATSPLTSLSISISVHLLEER